MNAHQPLPSPEPPRRKRKKRAYDSQSKAHRVMAAELTLKLTINSILTVISLVSLQRLLPYYLSQEINLDEVRDEIQDTETRVNELKTEFGYYFDRQESETQVQKYRSKMEEGERQIFWQEQP